MIENYSLLVVDKGFFGFKISPKRGNFKRSIEGLSI
jgi:hypothetical protein